MEIIFDRHIGKMPRNSTRGRPMVARVTSLADHFSPNSFQAREVEETEAEESESESRITARRAKPPHRLIHIARNWTEKLRNHLPENQ